MSHVLNQFVDTRIVVSRVRNGGLEALVGKESLRGILDFTRIPVKRRCDQRQLEDYPDLDLFALAKPQNKQDKWRLLAIINCKVSFHARHTEAAFWGLLVRLSSHIPYVVVTEDRDIYKPKSSELGESCTRSTATRRLLESFTDRVYLAKQYSGPDDYNLRSDIVAKRRVGLSSIIFDDPAVPNHTEYCSCVRPIDDLIIDLNRWLLEAV